MATADEAGEADAGGANAGEADAGEAMEGSDDEVMEGSDGESSPPPDSESQTRTRHSLERLEAKTPGAVSTHVHCAAPRVTRARLASRHTPECRCTRQQKDLGLGAFFVPFVIAILPKRACKRRQKRRQKLLGTIAQHVLNALVVVRGIHEHALRHLCV